MPAIDFPASPVEGNTYAAGPNLWKFNGEKWVIVPYGPESVPNYGSINGGEPPGVGNFVILNGGVAKSTFGSAPSLDAGSL